MSSLGERVRLMLPPPAYLTFPFAGVDVSTSGVKVAKIKLTPHGFALESYKEERIGNGVYANGDILNHDELVRSIRKACRAAGITAANATLPESKSYLFESEVEGKTPSEWRTSVEQRLEELVPLPPPETAFDFVAMGRGQSGAQTVAGVGFARRVVGDLLSVFDEAGLEIRALESETFAIARALLPRGDESTTLIIDVGKSTTKIAIVERRIPRFATTVGIGGHALTLAVQKHFGVTELEARRVKSERGIVPSPGNEDYIASMLSSVAAIRDEIMQRLEYWQSKAHLGTHAPVERAILVGGNSSVRGFPEYLEGAFKIPVTPGHVFTNFAPFDSWLPDLDYTESLQYATALGLALYDAERLYG